MHNKKFRSVVCLILAALMLFSVVFSALGSIGALAVSQSDIDALEAEKDVISAQKEEVGLQISDLQTQQATIIEQKEALDAQNELARQEIEIINEQIEIYEKLIEEKEEELEDAIDQEEYQKERFRARMRALQENGTLGYITFILQAESFSDLLTRVDNISEIMSSDQALEEKYIAARENVEVVKAEYEEIQEQQLIKLEESEARKAELEEEIAEASELIAELEADIEAFEVEYAANEAAEYALQLEIKEATDAFNEAQELLKAQIAAGSTSSSAYVEGSGSFMWPTPGWNTVTSPFGWRIHPIFLTEKYHSGIDIAANSGTSIYASDGGTIQTAVYSSSYGNYVVVNHGNGYTTLYAHMSSMAVSVGQTVSQGEVIGYVGSTGWSTGPHLHFEISLNGSQIDPEPFFSNVVVGY